jgi:hypothetical protein
MTVPLDKPIKRQVEIDGKPYTLTLGPESVTIVRKGARKGPCVTWASLLEGTPQLRHALVKSIEAAAMENPPRERLPVKKR